jgi:hypothetical protein
MAYMLERLCADHANLERRLRLLDGRASVPRQPALADIGVLVGTLYGLAHIPDVSHRPIEGHFRQLHGAIAAQAQCGCDAAAPDRPWR